MNARMVVFNATRKAALIVCAVAGLGTVTAAQTTYKLKVGAVGLSTDNPTGYRGTSQVTSDPPGIDCRAELLGGFGPTGLCTAVFPAGTLVNLTAAPLYDGTVNGWTGACAGQGATCHIQMTADLETNVKTIAKTYTLTIRGTGNAFGQVHSNDLVARPSIACSVVGQQTVGTCTTEFPSGQMVWLGREEPVNTFAQFIGWSGCGPLSDQYNCRMVMDGPKTVGAGWIAPTIIIRSSGGNGTGKVTGPAPFGAVGPFDCTITQGSATGICSALWETGPLPITLTATPTGNSVFLGWNSRWCSGTGPCVLSPAIQLDQMQMEIRAFFELPAYALGVTPAGSGSGTVAFSPPRPDCVISAGTANNNCWTLFPRGTAVTLTADPTGGSTFGGWSGVCSGQALTCAVVLNAEAHATARFTPPRAAADLAAVLLGRLTISDEEQRQLDRFGNKDGVFNLGDLLALIARTGERLAPSTLIALVQSQASGAVRRGDGRSQ